MAFIRRIARVFRSRDKEQPLIDQPIPEYQGIENYDEILAEAHALNRRLRHGAGSVFIENLKNVQRVIEYVGQDATVVIVPAKYSLVVEATIVHPTLGKYEVVVSFKSGQQYDAQAEQRMIAASAKVDLPPDLTRSGFLRESVVRKNYYLRQYRPLVHAA